jgi:hypothetical protein
MDNRARSWISVAAVMRTIWKILKEKGGEIWSVLPDTLVHDTDDGG